MRMQDTIRQEPYMDGDYSHFGMGVNPTAGEKR